MSLASKQHDPTSRILFAVICLGVAIRTLLFVWNPSFWIDEIFFAINFPRRGFVELFQPLDHGQLAPPLFLLTAKLLSQVLGYAEWSFRLIPYLSGVASLILFARYTKKESPTVQIIACSLLAFAPGLVAFSVNFKPYSSDLLTTVLILFAFRNPSRRSSLVACLLLPWFSFPAIFVICGMGAGHTLLWLYNRNKTALLANVRLTVAALLSFSLLYISFIATRSGTPELVEFWKNAYLQPPWLRLENYDLINRAIRSASITSLRMATPLLIIFTVIAVWRYPSRSLPPLMVLIAAITASVLQLYPFYDRLALYLAPCIALITAHALSILEKLPIRQGWVHLCLPFIILYPSHKELTGYCIHSSGTQEVRESLQFVEQNRAPNEPVYMLHGFSEFYAYYKLLYSWTGQPRNAPPSNSADPLIREQSYWVLAEARLPKHWDDIEALLQNAKAYDLLDSSANYSFAPINFDGVVVLYITADELAASPPADPFE
ncbi:hypothetical protein [Coraliomargarita akajimensis]|uniref:Glycosyltransferase RgtA/B/C/D-like domain-containing protein n=1 Tax=Coraliomargarita akajimensis (strain DSM 45221 / IAM 15411 / JCM 23193 / KCTC 12865 / 04OKA010-24) TaxID=583355 RepID=D5EMT0_CORAD|nr:hypothetical protein [Coraliomargarita akajimensis]ADE55320.1 hypothetical protein Caka_2303 [Coraliomargarita akajimensis DSM 45221]